MERSLENPRDGGAWWAAIFGFAPDPFTLRFGNSSWLSFGCPPLMPFTGSGWADALEVAGDQAWPVGLKSKEEKREHRHFTKEESAMANTDMKILTVAMRSAPEFHQRSLSLCENYPGGSPRAAWKGQAVKQPRCPRQAKPHAHQCKSSQATVLIRLTPQYAHTPGGHCQAFLPGRLALYPGFVHTCREGPEALVCG